MHGYTLAFLRNPIREITALLRSFVRRLFCLLFSLLLFIFPEAFIDYRRVIRVLQIWVIDFIFLFFLIAICDFLSFLLVYSFLL